MYNITGLKGLQVHFSDLTSCSLVIMTVLPWIRKHINFNILISSYKKHHPFCVTSLLQVLIFTITCIVFSIDLNAGYIDWALWQMTKKFSEIKIWPIWNLVSLKNKINGGKNCFVFCTIFSLSNVYKNIYNNNYKYEGKIHLHNLFHVIFCGECIFFLNKSKSRNLFI